MKSEKSCGVVVFRKQETQWLVLLIRHEKGRHISFPKGHIEDRETERQTAEREVLEETGLKVNADIRFRAENLYTASRFGIRKLAVFFIAVTELRPLKPQPGEIADAWWMDIPRATQLLTYENDRKILKDAYAFLMENY